MTCRTGKIEYPTAKAAHFVMAKQAKRPDAQKRAALHWAKGKLCAYRCPMCGGWHIGHAAGKGCRA